SHAAGPGRAVASRAARPLRAHRPGAAARRARRFAVARPRLTPSHNATHLAFAALLVWVLFALRAHQPLEMPVFVDESLHILRGRVVWQFSDLGESLNPKKLLFYY